MPPGRTPTRLNKRYITTYDGYSVYSVNAYAVRDIAQPDEEFGIFASQDEFADLIPKREIWIAEKSVEKEGVFFIADALVRFKEQERGVDPERAYTAGIDVERMLREKLNGLKFRAGKPHKRVPKAIYVRRYATLPDEQLPVHVWVVDGNQVRSLYKTDYVEGGHGYVYPWVPKDEIWIEENLDRKEMPYIVAHEYLELRLMRDKKIDYDHAHDICSKVEFKLRKSDGAINLLTSRRRKLTKADLPRLTTPEFFEYAVKHYVRK